MRREKDDIMKVILFTKTYGVKKERYTKDEVCELRRRILKMLGRRTTLRTND
jgi:hypothetical protein